MSTHRHVVDLAGVCTGPGPCDTTPLGTGKNWLQKVAGLPLYIRAVAHSLRRGGMNESRAVATAVATVKRWAAGGGQVTPATRARAVKAVAEWEAKKAASHSLTAAPTVTVDLVASTTDGPTLTEPARMAAAKQGKALPDGRFPIRNTADLQRAIKAVGRAKGDHDAVRRFIIGRAKALGASGMIPASWNDDGSVNLTAPAATTVDLVARYRHGWIRIDAADPTAVERAARVAATDGHVLLHGTGMVPTAQRVIERMRGAGHKTSVHRMDLNGTTHVHIARRT